jgi:ATP-dependent Clp protease ATP-binding subunit ClpC
MPSAQGEGPPRGPLEVVVVMQVAREESTRAVIDRARALAAERGARTTTLHLAAALLEQGGEGARFLSARGVRATDLKAAVKVHHEETGTFDRVQSNAKRIAAARATDVVEAHLLVAALGDETTALASLVTQLGADPVALAEEVLRASARGTRVLSAPQPAILYNTASAESGARPTVPSVRPPARTETMRPQARTTMPPTRRILSTPPPPSTPSERPASRPPTLNSPGSRDTPRPPRQEPPSRTTPPGKILSANGAPPTKSARPPTTRPARPEPTEHDLDPRTFPAIALFARNLSADSVRGVLEPVVGREREVRRALDAVARREGRGAVIIGAPGVGKSTLLRALAREPSGRTVLTLRHTEIVAQARSPQGAERVRKLVEELVRAGDRIIVALDPLAPWFLTREAPDEVLLELRAALATGKFAWIGTATHEEARRLGEVEPWLERAGMRVELEEPAGPALREAVSAYAPLIGAYHGVVAEPPVLERAAELSERYLGGRAQPDRALNVIDLALARAKRGRSPALSRELVAEIVAELGGVPYDRVAATDNERLLALEGHLGTRVVGHAHAMVRVAQTLRRNAVGFRGARPIGTFLFLGPTGVGKTETAKAIAEALFPGVGAMTRFDMAEFAEAHAVARLVGAPPGYVGYHDGGQLTEAVRRRPYQLILLDEIEKAHRDVLEALLALLDEGRMTDGRGRTVDFRNTVIVMTSNLGAGVFDTRPAPVARAIGFGVRPVEAEKEQGGLADKVLEAARAALPPELWNRIDDPVVFGPLTREEVSEIARRLLAQTFARLEDDQAIRVLATPAVVDLLLDNGGFEPTLGARPMRRAIARLVEAPIAESVLKGTLRRGDIATLEVRDWGIEVVAGAR